MKDTTNYTLSEFYRILNGAITYKGMPVNVFAIEQDEAKVADFAALFYSNRGKDWWKYLSYLLYKFAYDFKQITTTNASQAKFVLSFGGVAPNDPYCIMRCSYDVIKWGELSNGVKTAFGIDPRNQTSSLTLDYLQNYPGKKMSELHYIDYTNEHTPEAPIIVKQRMLESGRAAIRNGCTDLLFITMPKHGAFYDMTKELAVELKNDMDQNHDSSRQTANRSTSFSLGSLLNSGGSAGVSNWQAAGGDNGNRVNISFSNTISASTADLPYTLSLNDVSTYYFLQNEMRNRYFLDNTSVQASYISGKVGMLVPSHGITYQGVKTRSTITIKSKTTNVVWLKMIQNRGVTHTESGGTYANNHPEIRNLPFLEEDCRFWFPLDDYDIIIDVFDSTCYFSVMNPNTDAPYRFVSEFNVSANAQATTTVLKSTMLTQENMDWRLIKINNNRNFDTP